MKAIVFDIDNTLIEWKSEFIFALENVLKELGCNYSKKEINDINKYLELYEKNHTSFSKEELLKYINTNCKMHFSIDFINRLEIAQQDCVYNDLELLETIRYLSKKYDLYAISNWFTKTQTKRLEKMKVAQYFKNILGADKNYLKPDKRAFDIVIKKYKPSDCIVIGDSLEVDIKPALFLGMNAYWVTNKISKEYKTINNIYELRKIL